MSSPVQKEAVSAEVFWVVVFVTGVLSPGLVEEKNDLRSLKDSLAKGGLQSRKGPLVIGDQVQPFINHGHDL